MPSESRSTDSDLNTYILHICSYILIKNSSQFQLSTIRTLSPLGLWEIQDHANIFLDFFLHRNARNCFDHGRRRKKKKVISKNPVSWTVIGWDGKCFSSN